MSMSFSTNISHIIIINFQLIRLVYLVNPTHKMYLIVSSPLNNANNCLCWNIFAAILHEWIVILQFFFFRIHSLIFFSRKRISKQFFSELLCACTYLETIWRLNCRITIHSWRIVADLFPSNIMFFVAKRSVSDVHQN